MWCVMILHKGIWAYLGRNDVVGTMEEALWFDTPAICASYLGAFLTFNDDGVMRQFIVKKV